MFGIDARAIPPINDYAQALYCFESTKPWRGWSRPSDERPLTQARRKHMSVRVQNGVVRFKLHQTDVVSYAPDGTVVVQFYPSRSTVLFANRLLPPGLRAFAIRGSMWVRTNNLGGVTSFVNGLRFKRDEAGLWQLLNPEDAHRPSILRLCLKRAAGVRKRLKPFFAWARLLVALHAGKLGGMERPRAGVNWDDNLSIMSLAISSHGYVRDTWQKHILLQAYTDFGAIHGVTLPLGELPPLRQWRYRYA